MIKIAAGPEPCCGVTVASSWTNFLRRSGYARVSGAMITVGNLFQLLNGLEFNEDGKDPLSNLTMLYDHGDTAEFVASPPRCPFRGLLA